VTHKEAQDFGIGLGSNICISSIVSQMVTYLICDLRKEFFKRVQARFR